MSWYENLFSRWLGGRKKKVGLVLGGGVARGIAHIGVIKVLQSYKVPIDYIVGTSAGALIGAAVASGMDTTLLEQVVLRIRWTDFFKFALFQPGLTSSQAIEEFVDKYIGSYDFKELKIPFAAVATELKSGSRVVIESGSVSKAVAASATFPGLFTPSEVHKKLLIDGGIAANVPVDTARELGAEYIIASNAVPAKIHSVPKDSMQMFGHALDLILRRLSEAEASRADVLIELEMEEDMWHLDLNKAKKFIAAGEVAAHRKINRISRDLKLRGGS